MTDIATLEPAVANGSATASTKSPIKAVDPTGASVGERAGEEGLDVSRATYDEGDDEGVDDEYDFESTGICAALASPEYGLRPSVNLELRRAHTAYPARLDEGIWGEDGRSAGDLPAFKLPDPAQPLEEQQAVEGEDDEYSSAPAYNVDEDDDEDDDDGEYHDADGEGDHDHEHDHDHDHDHEYQPEASAGTNGGPAVAASPAAGGKPNLTALLLGDPNAADEDEDDFKEGDSDEDEDAEYNGEYDDEDDDGGDDDAVDADDYMEESTPITPTSRKRGIEEAKEEDGDEDADVEDEGASKKKVKA